jgi:hypothetical protein
MRLAADDPERRARLGAAAAEKVRRTLSGKVIGAQMAARLAEIRAELGGS